MAARRDILTNNIFGVDIDATAIEVAKLSLLLKALENIALPEDLQVVKTRALPDLAANLRCGNTLVGDDYLLEGTTAELDMHSEKTTKVNCFNWGSQAYGFGKILDKGGFDVVVGNPPYARVQSLTESQGKDVTNYFKKHYASATHSFDIYALFLEKGHQLLNRDGRLGFILPHKFLNATFGEGIREYLAKHKALNKLIDFGELKIFKDATSYLCLAFLTNYTNDEVEFTRIDREPKGTLESLPDAQAAETFPTPHPVGKSPWRFLSPKVAKLMGKLDSLPQRIGDVATKIFQGIATGQDAVFVLHDVEVNEQTTRGFSKALEKEVEIENGLLKPFLMARDVLRYQKPQPNKAVLFPYRFVNDKAILMEKKDIKEKFPKGWQYLLDNHKALKARENGKFDSSSKFYCLARPQNMTEYTQAKILMPDISNRCRISYDKVGLYFTASAYGVILQPKNNPIYILGLLNSRLLWFFLYNSGDNILGNSARFKTNYISPFPMPNISLDNHDHKAIHDQLVLFVESMLQLEQEIADTNKAGSPVLSSQQHTQLLRQRETLDTSIDALVYKLYDLSDEEIAVVKATPGNDHAKANAKNRP